MPKRTPLERRYRRRRLARKMLNPVRVDGHGGTVTTPYGKRGSLWALGYHTGEDFACPTGSRAVAVTWGKVVHVGTVGGWGAAYGIHVVIRTGSGRYDYAYCHLSRADVRVGQKVRPGMVIGLTGATGNVTGPHLHFEARKAGGRYGDDVTPRKVRRAW
jgi:murein DD-endopeptidase MepM/ murein hydrolase activator NlpD